MLFLLQTDYYYRSWLQSTLPLVQFWPSLDTELFVATGTINLKVKKSNQKIGLSKSCVPVNRITNYCPSCVTKARQLLSWPIIGHTRSRIKTATNERSRSRQQKQIILLYARALGWCNFFSRSQKISLQIALGLHSLFVKCYQSEKPKRKMLKSTKGATKREQEWCSRWKRGMTWKHSTKPLKKPRGVANWQSSQKQSLFLMAVNLGCILSFLDNAISN